MSSSSSKKYSSSSNNSSSSRGFVPPPPPPPLPPPPSKNQNSHEDQRNVRDESKDLIGSTYKNDNRNSNYDNEPEYNQRNSNYSNSYENKRKSYPRDRDFDVLNRKKFKKRRLEQRNADSSLKVSGEDLWNIEIDEDSFTSTIDVMKWLDENAATTEGDGEDQIKKMKVIEKLNEEEEERAKLKKKKKKKTKAKTEENVDISQKSDAGASTITKIGTIGSTSVPNAAAAATIPGIVPLPGDKSLKYGEGLLPGEGSAMAAYVRSDQRIPRRGEVGLAPEQIEHFEQVGYVMSGSRHQVSFFFNFNMSHSLLN